MATRTEMRTAVLRELGDDAGSEWSTNEINRAIDEVTADISRLMPQEKVNEKVIRLTVTDESFTSRHGIFVVLDSKPIRKGSVVITNSAATTTYTEYDDYEMDYGNGQVKTLSSGDMTDNAAHLIDYERDVPALSVSDIPDMITPLQIEWPIDEVPKSFAGFQKFGDWLILRNRGLGGQARLRDKDHVRIYYLAQHTAPTDQVNGSFPRWLDEVVIKGAVAYCLFIKHRKLNLQAEDDEGLARLSAGAYDDSLVSMSTAFNDIAVSLDSVTSSLAAIRGSAGEPLYDADIALDAVIVRAVAAMKKVNSQQPASGDISAAASANSGRNTIFTTSLEHGLETGDIVNVTGTTNYNDKFVVTKIGDTSFQINFAYVSSQTGFWARESHLHEASITLDSILAELNLLNTALDFVPLELGTAGTYLTAGDDLINKINIGMTPETVYREYAETKALIAQTLIQEANGRAQHVGAFVQEVEQRLSAFMAQLNAANTELSAAGVYIQEAAARNTIAQIIIQEANTHLQKGVALLSTIQRHIEVGELHLSAAQVYLEVARQDSDTADRFLADARDRHRDYWLHITARVEQARPRTTSATRQWASVDQGGQILPTGSEG